MAEKMLVTQALDERDLLIKKITDKVHKAKLVDTKKRNEEKTQESAWRWRTLARRHSLRGSRLWI